MKYRSANTYEENGEEMETSSFFGNLGTAIRSLDASYLLFAAAALCLLSGILLLRYRDTEIGDLWDTVSSAIVDRGFNIMLFATLLILLLLGLLSLSRFIWSSLVAESDFAVIAPFTITGTDDKQRGLALAMGLQSKLANVRADLETLDDELKDPTPSGADTPTPARQDQFHPLGVLRTTNIEAKIQGVDVGGVINWLVQFFSVQRALQISVAENDKIAIVSGPLRRDGQLHVYAKVEAVNERIVAVVAYSMLRERFVADSSDLAALDWNDFEALHLSVIALARLRHYTQESTKEYEEHYQTISKLILKAPNFRPLLILGTEVAMKAGKADQALNYLNRTRQFLDSSQDDYVRRYNALVQQRQRVIASCALPFVHRLNGHETKETVYAEALAKHRTLLKVADLTPKRDVSVAVIGGVPQREHIGYPFSPSNSIGGDADLDNFADTLGLIIHSIAPQAKLQFIPLDINKESPVSMLTKRESAFEQALRAAQQMKVDVILLPFAFSPVNARVDQRINALREASKGRAIVVTPSASKRLQDGAKQRLGFDFAAAPIVFVSYADVDGRFTGGLLDSQKKPASYPNSLWAPGMRYPRLRKDGIWITGYGINYAAAATAAVAANVLSAGFGGSQVEFVELLRRTSRPVGTEPEVKVIDQTAALANGPSAAPSPPSVLTQDTCK